MREGMATDELAAFHCDPLYVECRAYGRMKELRRQGIIKRRLAAESFEFPRLKPQEEEEVSRMGADPWDQPKEDGY